VLQAQPHRLPSNGVQPLSKIVLDHLNGPLICAELEATAVLVALAGSFATRAATMISRRTEMQMRFNPVPPWERSAGS